MWATSSPLVVEPAVQVRPEHVFEILRQIKVIDNPPGITAA
jgi:hypothetical protein